MERSQLNFFWGFLLYLCGQILEALTPNLMRATNELRPSQTVAMLSLTEAVTLLPFCKVLLDNWGLKTSKEWVVFFLLSLASIFSYISFLFSSQRMAVGNLTAIITSCMLFTPVLLVLIHRRCVNVIEFLGLVLALVGASMVAATNSSFQSLLSNPDPNYPFLPTLGAIYTGLEHVCFPFAIGVFKNIHWSNYVFLRGAVSVLLAPIYLTFDGGWSLPGSWTNWQGVILSLQIGAILNLTRVVDILGCQELESSGAGTAGVVGNLLNACVLPIGATIALALYDETMEPLAIGGSLVILASMVSATLLKFFFSDGEDKREDYNEEEEKMRINDR